MFRACCLNENCVVLPAQFIYTLCRGRERNNMLVLTGVLASALCLFPGSWEMCGPGGTEVSELCTAENIVFSLNHYPTGYECYRSLDNGETWELSAIPDYSAMGLSSDCFGRVFIPGNENIMISRDLGETWTTSFTFAGAYCRSADADPADSLHLLAAVSNSSTSLLESVDGGNSWAAVQGMPGGLYGYCVAFAESSPSTVYWAGYQQGSSSQKVYKSTDSGENWVDITPSPSQTVGGFPRFDLLVSPDDENTAFVSVKDKLYCTDDGGVSWNQVLDADKTIEDVVLPGSSGSIYAASSSKLYRSSDGGQTWNSDEYSTGLVWAVTLSDMSGERIHIGTSSGNFYSDTLLTAWTSSDTGIPGGRVYALLESENSGFPVLTGNGYFLNEDPSSWAEAGTGVLGKVFQIERSASDPQLLYMIGDAG